MYYLDLLDQLGQDIRDGASAWIPTPNGWLWIVSLALDRKPEWLEQPPMSQDQRTIFVNSLEMFKVVAPELHPRIETLLSMHRKPLSLVLDGGKVVQNVQSDYLKDLIRHVGAPIVGYRFEVEGREILDYETLPMEALEDTDFISAHRPTSEFELPVLADYNHKAVLNFIRE